MTWLYDTVYWYLMLLGIGIIFFPITKKLFGKLFIDSAYPFAKIIGIICISYLAFILGIFKFLNFSQITLFFLIFLFATINFVIYKKDTYKYKFNWPLICVEEGLFFLGLLFWTYVRGQEPSVHGLEKFMDFGFINSILRSDFFPPKDIWMSGMSINYYYFGHLIGATLIKICGIVSDKGYNLLVATIFAFGISLTFSFVFNLINKSFKDNLKLAFFGAIIGTYILNFSGNLHPIYLFTSGYNPDVPVPFWEIFSTYSPEKYWYPNATRFIPFTIHEFPLYSYVVADLHGHVFDIPIVLLTILFIYSMFLEKQKNYLLPILGFMLAICYMTNAFDGAIYLLLIGAFFLIFYGISKEFFLKISIVVLAFIFFTTPFSKNFSPFVSGIGVNCSPEFLTNIGKFGPFLFEKGNCQTSEPWMLFILWGFFFVAFILFSILLFTNNEAKNTKRMSQNIFVTILFVFSFFLVVIPEFFYIKDIYPAHFRANTMFKLGYQAFMMMSIASAYVFALIKKTNPLSLKNIQKHWLSIIFNFIFMFFFLITAIYPIYAIGSYYGNLGKEPVLKGDNWIKEKYPEYLEIINYLNKNVKGQPVVLEAQGDSYTDFNVISAYTGLPTLAGWYVHEWLWRGSPALIAERAGIVQNIYESKDLELTNNLIAKYQIKYIVIAKNEKAKYENIYEEKFQKNMKLIFTSSNKSGALYQVN
jgi:uncharacterized membrane protein